MTRLSGILAMCAALPLSAAPAPYRAVVYDVSDLTRVRVVIDAQTRNGKALKIAANEFRLVEDGHVSATAERVGIFKDTDLGAALIVLLDASPSMEGKPLQAIRRGLAQLVTRKRDQDRIAVLSFANDFRWETKWNAPAADVERAFRELQIRGNRSRLYDAVSHAMDEFEAEGRRDSTLPKRRAILVLSDGRDEGSETTLARQVDRLSHSRVRLDAVGLVRSPQWLTALQQLAEAGYGEFRTAPTPEVLTTSLQRGMDVLLQTPVPEFSAKQLSADGRNHDVGVEHIGTGWRDTTTVEMPEGPIYADRRMWGAAGAVLIVIVAALFLSRGRTRTAASTPAPQPVASPAAVAAPSPTARTAAAPQPKPRVPVRRTPTVADPTFHAMPVTEAPRAAAAHTSLPAPMPRPATVLAPQTSERMLLVAISGPHTGQRVELAAPEFWIGSANNNNLSLPEDPAVSGNHACIRREGSLHRLYDNGSLNNTWVNGKPTGPSAVLLQQGDRIVIGHSEFIFQS